MIILKVIIIISNDLTLPHPYRYLRLYAPHYPRHPLHPNCPCLPMYVHICFSLEKPTKCFWLFLEFRFVSTSQSFLLISEFVCELNIHSILLVMISRFVVIYQWICILCVPTTDYLLAKVDLILEIADFVIAIFKALKVHMYVYVFNQSRLRPIVSCHIG